MDKKETTGTYQDRIHLLEAFQKAIMRWFNRNHEPEGRDELKSYINRNLMAVRSMVEDAGTLRLMALTPPPRYRRAYGESRSISHDFPGLVRTVLNSKYR